MYSWTKTEVVLVGQRTLLAADGTKTEHALLSTHTEAVLAGVSSLGFEAVL